MAEKVKKITIEIEGTNVEDAINNAVQKLNVTKDEIEFRVVCEEKKGLFGMEGAHPAKIIVSLKKNNK